ncbi:MAG: TonB C-terminal domain-containing protein [Myxococcota bacterium]
MRQASEQGREFRRRLIGSAVGHVLFLSALAFTPAPPAKPLPAVVTIDLLARLPGTPAPPRAAPRARPKQAKVVLPREAPPARTRPVSPRSRTRPEELEYDDALAKLREELGESTPPDSPEPVDGLAELAQGSGAGTPVSREFLAWVRDTKRHVWQTYVTPPEFLNRGLITCMDIFLGADGQLLGAPTLRRTSGNPFWDDNAVRAVMRASPLPPPPRAGEFSFCFPSEERE